ncbi:MAG: lipopolysaccharide biosynthesis protein [Elusimicrobiota bacterium]
MRFKIRPILKDISFTFITEAIILLTFFVIYRLVAKNFGPKGIGEYTLIRRIVGFLSPILLLGIGIGMPRYIAISKDEKQRSAYIKTGASIVIIFTFIFLLFANLFKIQFTKIFFRFPYYVNFVLPSSFFIFGFVSHTLLYSYFRGRLLIKTLNCFQIINIALVPLLILLFIKTIRIAGLISLIGISNIVITGIFFMFFINEFFIHGEKGQLRECLKELVSYSFPRVFGDFAFFGLLSLGPIIAVHFVSIQEVGYLSISQSLLSAAGSAMAPLGIIILPKVSSLIREGREKTIKENLVFFLASIFHLSIFVSIQLIIFADFIVKYWLGADFLDAVPVLRSIFVSIMFFVFYIGMRNILDAVAIKPLNTINLFVSLGIFLLSTPMLLCIFKFFVPIVNLGIAFSFSVICLGILTYFPIIKINQEVQKKWTNNLLEVIIINILLHIVAILSKPFLIYSYRFVIFEIFLFILYFSILWSLKIEWLRQIPKIIKA